MARKVNPALVGMLRRMDPAELLIFGAMQGFHYQPERAGMTKAEILDAEERVLTAGAHQARLAAPKPFTKAELDESRQWLTANRFENGTTQ